MFSLSKAIPLTVVAFAACVVFPAFAAVPIGTAHTYDLSGDIDLLVTQLAIDPQTQVEIVGSSQDEDLSQQVNSFFVSDPLDLIEIGTGVLLSQAQFVVGNVSAIEGASEVNNLELSAVGPAAVPVLSVQASLVTSRSSVSGYCPMEQRNPAGPLDEFIYLNGFDTANLAVGGGGAGAVPGSGSELGDLQISILGIPVSGLPSLPPPNTVVDLSALGIVGATLVLNEQVVEGDGSSSAFMSTNAIHLTLNSAGLATADVIIGHSDAQLQCP